MGRLKTIFIIGLLCLLSVTVGCATSTNLSSPSLTSSQQSSADGKTLYATNCANCHGAKGEGGSASALNTGKKVEDVIDVTKSGIDPVMPGYTGKLSDAQISAIANYVVSLKK